MEPVEPWLPAVRPFIQEAIRASGVTSMINTSSNTAAALRDNKVIWLLGGLAVGFYFGFRVGAVSGRARRYVASKRLMRAAALNSYVGVKGVSLQEVEQPILVRDTDVLIQVKAASLDPVDLKVSQGFGRGLRDLVNKYNPNVSSNNFPVILGRDGTGVISQVGSEVTGLKEGDRVWFVVPYCVQGSLSTLLVLDQDHVRLLPPCLTYEAGATLPYVGMVSWDLLVTMAGLGPHPASRGVSVFIWGGVRALERLCVQLCSEWGCEGGPVLDIKLVTCVAPLYTHHYLTSLGASHVLPDDMVELSKLLQTGKRFDVVVNTAGLLAEDFCLSLAGDEGRIVSVLVQPPGFQEYGLLTSILAAALNNIWSCLKYNLLGGDRDWRTTRLDGSVLDYLGELVSNGKIDPVGEKIYSLEQVELAFRSLAAGGNKGKLVVRMESEEQQVVAHR